MFGFSLFPLLLAPPLSYSLYFLFPACFAELAFYCRFPPSHGFDGWLPPISSFGLRPSSSPLPSRPCWSYGPWLFALLLSLWRRWILAFPTPPSHFFFSSSLSSFLFSLRTPSPALSLFGPAVSRPAPTHPPFHRLPSIFWPGFDSACLTPLIRWFGRWPACWPSSFFALSWLAVLSWFPFCWIVFGFHRLCCHCAFVTHRWLWSGFCPAAGFDPALFFLSFSGFLSPMASLVPGGTSAAVPGCAPLRCVPLRFRYVTCVFTLFYLISLSPSCSVLLLCPPSPIVSFSLLDAPPSLAGPAQADGDSFYLSLSVFSPSFPAFFPPVFAGDSSVLAFFCVLA